MIPEAFLQELTQRASIEQVVLPHVELRSRGRTLQGLCPFHNEKTPSFYVYPESNSFYCFGCGAGGGTITFVMRMERLDFVEAVKWLCQRVGLQMPDSGYDDSLGKQRLRQLEANREAARFFFAQLREPSGRAGLAYWTEQRALTLKTIRHFGLGYAPDAWDALLTHMRAKGFVPAELEAANLVGHSTKNGDRYYDRFRNRVMVPILDLRGNVIAFGGRVLDDSKPKYINSSDTLVYKKGHDLFALGFAKQKGRQPLVLTEGYMDAIAMHQHGFSNAVAGLGTALTREQAQLLARYTDEVVLCYDADEAGQLAAQKALHLLEQTPLKLRVVRLQGGKDPDAILRTHGAERLRKLLEGAENDIEFKLLQARGTLDLQSAAGKAQYLNQCAGILARCTQVEQDIYAARLSEELGVRREALLAQVSQVRRREDRQQSNEQQRALLQEQRKHSQKLDAARAQNPVAAKAEEKLLGQLMQSPEVYRLWRGKLAPGDFVTPLNRSLAELLWARLASGQDIAPDALAAVLEPRQLDELLRMKMVAETTAIEDLQAEAEGCMAALHAQKPGAATADLHDDATFLTQFERMNGGSEHGRRNTQQH